jgi:hypothetical protein
VFLEDRQISIWKFGKIKNYSSSQSDYSANKVRVENAETSYSLTLFQSHLINESIVNRNRNTMSFSAWPFKWFSK